jgi:hypothetical protein
MQPQNTVSYPKIYARRPSMTWDVGLFILNRLVEPVKTRTCCGHGFKERHTTKIVNDNFTRKALSCFHMYNHPRKWRARWNHICKVKAQGQLQWSNDNNCFVIVDEEKLQKHLMVR